MTPTTEGQQKNIAFYKKVVQKIVDESHYRGSTKKTSLSKKVVQKIVDNSHYKRSTKKNYRLL